MGLAYDKQNTRALQLGAHTESESSSIDYGSNAARQEEMNALAAPEGGGLPLSYGARPETSREEALPDWAKEEDTSFEASLPNGTDALKRQFLGQRFEEKNHTPSTGDGLFDVAYDPASGELVATLHIAVRFTHAIGANPWMPTGWTAPEQQEALYQLMKSAQSAWSGKHVIRCTKPGWEDVTATPRLVVNAFPEEQGVFTPHYTIDLHKERESKGIDEDRPSVDHPRWWRRGGADFEQDDLEDKRANGSVYETEFERLSAALPVLALAHGAQGWALTDENERALTAFAQALGSAPPSTYRPELITYGWGGAGTPESGAAMRNVTSEMRDNNVKNRLKTTSASGNPDGTITFEIQPVERWPKEADYNASAHEIGHMLGLQDEYATADEEGHGMSKAHQQLLDASGIDQHLIDADTTSIMANGKDVMPAHYATLWEALGQMTAGFVQPKEWKL